MAFQTQFLVASVCLMFAVPAFGLSSSARPHGMHRHGAPCLTHASNRNHSTQGRLLWGTKPNWTGQPAPDDWTTVLASVNLSPLSHHPHDEEGVQLQGGRLVPRERQGDLTGTLLQGQDSNGDPVEVALCDATPNANDPDMVLYTLDEWNPLAQDWENPCVATHDIPYPKALALQGTWDRFGAHQNTPGKFTFACETGALFKCVNWGYKPWASIAGKSLATMHQACTRMARADYCGNGKSFTKEDSTIDFYDAWGVSSPTNSPDPSWDPARAAFEASWTQDGASCLGRGRNGLQLQEIYDACPGRFQLGTVDLGQGDLCQAYRPEEVARAAPLRNRIQVDPLTLLSFGEPLSSQVAKSNGP